MNRTPIKASVHRFHDYVALSIGNGGTVYITAADARKFTRAINKVAKSIKVEKFVDSPNDLSAAFTFDGKA